MVPAIRVGRLEINIRHALGFMVILVAWWWIARQLGPARLPAPGVVAERFFPVLTHSPEIFAQGGGHQGIGPHLVASVVRVLLGATIGMSLGIGVGLMMGWSQTIGDLLRSPIEVLRAVPPLALAPFLLIWYGPTITTQMGMLILYTFLALVINTVAAIRNVSPVHVQFAETLGATHGQVYRTVILPAIVPELVGGIRVGIALSWGIAVVTELLGAREGIGKVFSMMLTAQGLDIIIISIIYVTLIALVIDLIFVRVADRWTRWVPRA
jgi:ABC-type nitrate/sulfonate/bicarbonate transport system permease component